MPSVDRFEPLRQRQLQSKAIAGFPFASNSLKTSRRKVTFHALSVYRNRRTLGPSRYPKIQCKVSCTRSSNVKLDVAFERIRSSLAQRNVGAVLNPSHPRRNIKIHIHAALGLMKIR